MKSKDLWNVVLSKYQNGDIPTKIYHDLGDAMGLRIIKGWCQTGIIILSSPPDRPRLVTTTVKITKVKNRLCRKAQVSTRKTTMELDI